MIIDEGVYRPRNPRAGAYYQCVESHFEELEQVWDDRYAPRFGFWRPYITVASVPMAVSKWHLTSTGKTLKRLSSTKS